MIGNQIVTRILLQQDMLSFGVVKLYLEFLIICIIIVIVAVPEGIPLAMGIAWAQSLTQMLAQGLRVKNINSPTSPSLCRL
jgi:hypothetical protein